MDLKSRNFTYDNGSTLKEWIAKSNPTESQIKFVDSVYDMCERNYERGGDVIIECWLADRILEEFKTLKDVKEYCGLMVEQALNARWGEDSDPQLEAYEAHKDWGKGEGKFGD